MSDLVQQSVLARFFWAALDRSALARLGLALVAVLAASALAVAAPLVLKFAIDALERPQGASIAALGGLYMVVLGLQRLAEQAQTYAFGTGEQRLQQRLSSAIFKHVLTLPMGFHVERQAGALMETLTLGLQGARLIFTHIIFSVLPVAIQAVLIGVVVAAVFDLALWVTLATAIIAYGVVFAIGVERLQAPTRAVSSAQVEAGGLFNDGIVNVEPVKSFGAEAQLSTRYAALMGDAELRWRKFHARRFENGAACAGVFVLTMGAVLIQGAALMSAGRIGIGDFVLLNAYVLQIVRPLEMAGFALRDIAQASHYLERWREMLLMAPEGTATRVEARADENDGAHHSMIAFNNVAFGYGQGPDIIRNVSFSLGEGRSLAIVGPSGAGKSSLLRLLMRYYEPRAGSILIRNAALETYDLDRLRAMIAIVSQDTVLFNASLEDNVRLARPCASQLELSRALELAGLEELIARLPQGLGSPVGERGLKLSGGERQRIAIARAALKQAPILALDEPTSALDALNESAISSNLMAAASGRTTLVVTHRLTLARLADEILVLDEGKVAEQGAHSDLIARNGVYARMWATQARAGDGAEAA